MDLTNTVLEQSVASIFRAPASLQRYQVITEVLEEPAAFNLRAATRLQHVISHKTTITSNLT
jgi:hypothetical protein